jgi:hypothetical protein
MTSRGGAGYDRTFLEAFFRPGRDPANWVSRSNMAALGVMPTGVDEMSIYYTQHYAQPTHHLLRTTLRLDGFASLHAGHAPGELVTRALRFDGERLLLNFATSAAGSVQVELQDADGSAIPGFTLVESQPLVGDRIAQAAAWEGGRDLTALRGRAVRLRLVLADADVYAFQFAPAPRAAAPAVGQAEPESEADAGVGPAVETHRIWDEGKHNAFTDLARYRDRWFCVFREATGHVSADGKIRVLTSSDGEAWRSAALLGDPASDLRDPKLETTPDGRLMLLAAASWHAPDAPVSRQPVVWFSRDGSEWEGPTEVGEADRWLWRVTWRDGGAAYGVGYACGGGDARFARLYRTEDGVDYEVLVPTLVSEGYPNEATVRFTPEGEALCLLRRDGEPSTALLGRAEPPYTAWRWRDLGVRAGGPNFIRLADGRYVAAVRLYDGAVHTALAWLDPERGRLDEFHALPSGGDTSYAGLVEHDGRLWVSYYSSHEGRTSIYLARVPVPAVAGGGGGEEQ